MKVSIQDQSGTQLTGWKYWGIIAVVVGGLSSAGSVFPELTPLQLYNSYQSDCNE
jgi:hypothetical protein